MDTGGQLVVQCIFNSNSEIQPLQVSRCLWTRVARKALLSSSLAPHPRQYYKANITVPFRPLVHGVWRVTPWTHKFMGSRGKIGRDRKKFGFKIEKFITKTAGRRNFLWQSCFLRSSRQPVTVTICLICSIHRPSWPSVKMKIQAAFKWKSTLNEIWLKSF
jgi:hypothetical protein